jgi:glutamate---cysteine ligase / carboxylate-amine ligase
VRNGDIQGNTRAVSVRSVGVEEEFLLLDRSTGAPRAVASTVLRAGQDLEGDLTGELQAEQLETGTYPQYDLDEIRREILTRRCEAATAAHRAGVEAVPLATCPMPVDPHIADGPRYAEMARRFGHTATEQLTCGCHVHVAVASDEEAVAVVDRIQPWLAVLLALSVNSPFWAGIDSGYGSYRSQVQIRWPSAGPTSPFGSAARYREVTEHLLRTDTLMDRGMLYFDARRTTTPPSRSASPTSAAIPATPSCSRGWSAGWSRPRPANGQRDSRPPTSASRCCGWPPGAPDDRGSTTTCSCPSTGGRCRPRWSWRR